MSFDIGEIAIPQPGSEGSSGPTQDVINLDSPEVLEDPQKQDPTTQPPQGGCGLGIDLNGCDRSNRLKLFLCNLTCEHKTGACRRNCEREERPHSDVIFVEIGTCVPANAQVRVQWGWTVVLPTGRQRFEWEPRYSDQCTVTPKDRFCTFSKTLTTGTNNNFNGPPSQCSKYTFKARLVAVVGNRQRIVDTMSIVVDCHKCYLDDTPDIEMREVIIE